MARRRESTGTRATRALTGAGLGFAVHHYRHTPGASSYSAEAAAALCVPSERATGYVLGGISPFGQRRRHGTVLDVSALGHATEFVSAGRRGVDLELDPADLVRLREARTGTVGRPAG